MVILGKNNDDKGTQLELLTKKILESIGYKNIVKSNIGPGGEEVDVTGEWNITHVNGEKVIRKLICECKAHTKNNNMNDWLKFLGKVFVEEIERNEEVFGCFIALTGVNGNVQGGYEALKNKKSSISLITGDNLLKICKSIFNLCDLKAINNKISVYTDRIIRRIDIVYYDLVCYWIVIYENYDYTILNSDSEFIDSTKFEILQNLLKNCNSLSLGNYINLENEAKSIERKKYLKGTILSEIIENQGRLSINNISSEKIDFLKEEINLAIKELVESNMIIESGEEICFIEDTDENFYSMLIDIYKFLLNNYIKKQVFGCKYYDEHINIELVKEILKIQGNLKLSDTDINEVVSILRLSPNALKYSLYPEEMIVNHRKDIKMLNEKIDLEDKEYFLMKLYSFIKFDFRNPTLREYFYSIRNIREIESLEEIKIKTEEKIINQNTSHERIGVGKLTEELGGGFINLLITSDAEEPWDLYKK